jgi:biotin carboxyl carrier protein
MQARGTTELLVRRAGAATFLLAPEVGLFTSALPAGSLLGPGQHAGILLAHGRQTKLVVPAGVAGRITSPRPERVHEPVAYLTRLYELAPLAEGDVVTDLAASAADEAGLIVRATQTGRFYQRPSPDEPAYVEVGGELVDGQALGLLEIMKTFNQVSYKAGGKLPKRARVVRWLARDGGEVRQGEGLLEVEAP